MPDALPDHLPALHAYQVPTLYTELDLCLDDYRRAPASVKQEVRTRAGQGRPGDWARRIGRHWGRAGRAKHAHTSL